jgi:hypothetical protein
LRKLILWKKYFFQLGIIKVSTQTTCYKQETVTNE